MTLPPKSHPVDVFADPDPDLRSLRRAYEIIAADAARALDLIDAIGDAQWSAAPRARAGTDTNERAKGGHSDPTFVVVSDPRRLALREQIKDSIRALRPAQIAVAGTLHGLRLRLSQWEFSKDVTPGG